MAQQPAKIAWKQRITFGLSASQFGMALGFCGKISDYINYLQHIVGTELEFKGNASTDHGIRTEPKSRALYELVTGCSVEEGSFFLSSDGLLGCSPDGRIFYDVDTTEGRGSSSEFITSRRSSENTSESLDFALTDSQQRTCVSVPFHKKRRRHSTHCASDGGITIKTQRVRLLEIKSPFNSLYDGSKPGYQPFGIPLHYMCQMQGQMAIANCEECDFFVYLDHPQCQCVCWRVKRSREFWSWAEPKLLQLVHWVRSGPPEWLDRSFEYKPFNFSSIEVVPLVFPFDLTLNAVIEDTKKFPFFFRCAPPQEWNTFSILPNWRSVLGLEVVRYLFNDNPLDDYVVMGVQCSCRAEYLSEAIGWNSLCDELVLLSEDGAGVQLKLLKPNDWERGTVEVQVESSATTFHLRFSNQRLFSLFTEVRPLIEPLALLSTPPRRASNRGGSQISQKIKASLSPIRNGKDTQVSERSGTQPLLQETEVADVLNILEESEECVSVEFVKAVDAVVESRRRFDTIVDDETFVLVVLPESVLCTFLSTTNPVETWEDTVKGVFSRFVQDKENKAPHSSGSSSQVVYCVVECSGALQHYVQHSCFPPRVMYSYTPRMEEWIKCLSSVFPPMRGSQQNSRKIDGEVVERPNE